MTTATAAWVTELCDALGSDRRPHRPRRDGVLRPGPGHAGARRDAGRRRPAAQHGRGRRGELELGLSLGGTITGEPGVGSIKVDWLEREIGPVALDVHRAIKDALDPAGLLNPGKVFRRASVADLAAVSGVTTGS